MKPSTIDDLFELDANLCAEDRLEMALYDHSSPIVPLLMAYTMSHQCWTVRKGRLLVCLFGIVRAGDHGTVWLLSSGMWHHRRQLHKWMPVMLAYMQQGCRTIGNYVAEFQTQHINWLKHYGFKESGKYVERNGIRCIELVREVGNV